jgi:ABC-type nitrate/sulfonate/bicarbonate transport system substrate-binding protein
MKHARATFLAGGLAAAATLAPRPGASQSATPIRLIYFGVASNVPAWIAIAKGFFAKESLAVATTVTPGSAFMYQHLSAGDFDLAISSIDNAVAYDEGQGEAQLANPADFFAFMGGDNGFLRLYARPEIRGYADLKGKTLAVDAFTTGFAFVMRRMLEKNGLDEGGYKLAAAGGTPQRLRALLADDTYAATILTPPFDFVAQDRGFKNLGDAIDVLGRYQAYSGVARRAWAQANGDVLVRYIRAHLAAIRWLYEPANKAEATAILSTNTNTSPEIAAKVYGVLVDRTSGVVPTGAIDIEGTKTVLALRSAYGVPKKTLTDPMKYIDESYYRRALS